MLQCGVGLHERRSCCRRQRLTLLLPCMCVALIWSGMCIAYNLTVSETIHIVLVCQPTHWQDASITIGSANDISHFLYYDALSSNVFKHFPSCFNKLATNSQQKVAWRHNETQTAAFTSFSTVMWVLQSSTEYKAAAVAAAAVTALQRNTHMKRHFRQGHNYKQSPLQQK